MKVPTLLLFLIISFCFSAAHGQTGNVGIGTTTPTARLDVAGATEADTLRIKYGGTSKDFMIKADTAGNVGFRKSFRGAALRYIICTSGCYPSQNGPACTAPMIGEVRAFAGTSAPFGWAFCEGQLLPISQHTALFSLLGTHYGGNGQSTFALPDLRGAVPVGTGASVYNTWTQGEVN